jgi:ribosomal protein L12E/L44/L45/RPP1/RPP2
MSKKNKTVAQLPQHDAPVPRSMEEINKVYQELCMRAGELQYRILVSNGDLDNVNEALANINSEGAARIALDAKAKEAANAQG